MLQRRQRRTIAISSCSLQPASRATSNEVASWGEEEIKGCRKWEMAGRQLLAHLLRLAKILRAPPDILFISVAGQICALSSQAWAQFDWLGGATRGSRAAPRPKRHLSMVNTA